MVKKLVVWNISYNMLTHNKKNNKDKVYYYNNSKTFILVNRI